MGARVLSVDGPFNSRVIVDMSADDAHKLFGDEWLGDAGPSIMLEAVERDLGAIAGRDEALASGTLAATARSLAIRLENPYTSSTAAAMCAKALNETMDRLLELVPKGEEKDELSRLRDERDARRAPGRAAAADPARP